MDGQAVRPVPAARLEEILPIISYRASDSRRPGALPPSSHARPSTASATSPLGCQGAAGRSAAAASPGLCGAVETGNLRVSALLDSPNEFHLPEGSSEI